MWSGGCQEKCQVLTAGFYGECYRKEEGPTGNCHAKIADLGLACVIPEATMPPERKENARVCGGKAGTNRYKALELVKLGTIGPSNDVFGMGLIFYELIFRNVNVRNYYFNLYMAADERNDEKKTTKYLKELKESQTLQLRNATDAQSYLEREEYLKPITVEAILDAFRQPYSSQVYSSQVLRKADAKKWHRLLRGMLRYRPDERLTAEKALRQAREQSGIYNRGLGLISKIRKKFNDKISRI